jgi:hypothetical protein
MPEAAAPPRPAFANGQNFREVGLHQCPSERKGEGVPVRRLRVPSHVPSHPQTAAKVPGFSPIAPRRCCNRAVWSLPGRIGDYRTCRPETG